MKERKQQGVRKPAVLTGVGLVVLGLISGLYAYESVRGNGASMKEGMAEGRMVIAPPVDASRPGTSETATFALG